MLHTQLASDTRTCFLKALKVNKEYVSLEVLFGCRSMGLEQEKIPFNYVPEHEYFYKLVLHRQRMSCVAGNLCFKCHSELAR